MSIFNCHVRQHSPGNRFGEFPLRIADSKELAQAKLRDGIVRSTNEVFQELGVKDATIQLAIEGADGVPVRFCVIQYREKKIAAQILENLQVAGAETGFWRKTTQILY
jgi:hypothetical protein